MLARLPNAVVIVAALSVWQGSAASPAQHRGNAPSAGACRITSSERAWVLQSPRMRVTVSRSTGQILSLYAGREMLSAPAGVVVTDKAATKTYGAAEGRIDTGSVHANGVEASITFSKTLDAEHRAIVTLKLTPDALRWDVEATTSLSPAREATVDFVLPVLSRTDEAFWAAPGTPVAAARLGTREIVYRTGTYVPWFAVYDRATDHGLSLVAPPDVPKPGLTFLTQASASPYTVRVLNHHLRMGPGRSARASLFLVPHEGDWRPGLAWLAARYPAYFRPVSRHVRDGEGWYTIGSPTVAEPAIKDLATRGVTWQELHGHFPFYGLYLPDSDTWPVAMDQDAIGIDRWERRDAPGLYVNSLANMRAKLDTWHQYGIQVYLYYQTFEAWHLYAEKYFASDIARDAAGAPCTAWQFCDLMNPDPAYPWGNAILGQLDRIVASYPGLDGVFLDRDDYRDYDFSHDDGVSMQDSRPCYMLGFAQEKALVGIGSRLHPRNMGIWTNGPTSLEVCKGVDGIMSEAVGVAANLIQLLGIERPMICLPYDMDARSTEAKLKTCLAGGYFPAATDAGPGSPSRAVEAKYAPLFKLMKGRKWMLNAHAITVPEDLQGNLFQADNGDYLAAVVGTSGTQVASEASAAPAMRRSVPVRVVAPTAASIRHCYLLSGDYSGVSELAFSRTGSALRTTIPLHVAASLLVFTPRPRYGLLRQSLPVLVRGATNRVQVRSAPASRVAVDTPWGSFEAKRSQTTAGPDATANVRVPLEAAKGEALLTLASQQSTADASAWVVDPVEVHPVGDVFLRDADGDEVPVEVANYTNQPQQVTLSGAFVEGGGTVRPDQPSLALKPHEVRAMAWRVSSTAARGRVEWRAACGERTMADQTPIGTVTRLADDDLFHDDFGSGKMDKWTVSSGTWSVAGGAAHAKGLLHLALAGDPAWTDYSFEATSRSAGSSEPSITWLKSYLFFRAQGPDSFYRFGYHGDGGNMELAKCVRGQWTTIAMTPGDVQKDKWVTFRVVAKGPDIRCFVDGKQVLQANDGTLTKGGIGIGVLEDGMVNTYRNVVVKRVE